MFVGTGQTCVRGSGTQCGDGGDAKLAMLTNPKGKPAHDRCVLCFCLVYLTWERKIGCTFFMT